MVMNFQHLKKKMPTKIEKTELPGPGDTKQHPLEQDHEQNIKRESKNIKKESKNPHTSARRFTRSSTILAPPEMGENATPQDCWCYGCIFASVDAPGTTDERWLCVNKTGEGDDIQYIYRPVREFYTVADCQTVKSGKPHREVIDG